MKPSSILVINFEMDLGSPVLAWQAKVAQGLAQRHARVDVLTHRIGDVRLPANCHVHRFPILPQRRILRSLGGWRFLEFWVANRLRGHLPDACFIHMHFSWAHRLRKFFRRHRIPVLLWYAHGTVTPELELALASVDRVVTSTPEGFRIASDKVRIIGQAIDTDLFVPGNAGGPRNDLVYVGRIAERKRIDSIIACFAALVRLAPDVPFKLRLIGPALTAADREYEARMRRKAEDAGLGGRVEFTGPLRTEELPGCHAMAFAHINLGETGSMDKTVMEALACGCPVLTTGVAFREALAAMPGLHLTDAEPEAVASRLLAIHRNPGLYPAQALRDLVVGKHDLGHYLDQLESQLAAIAAAKGGG